MHAAADAPSPLQWSVVTAHVDDRLTFELADLFLPSRIVVVRLPAGWGLKGIRYRGRDIRNISVRFESNPDPRALDVQLTSKVAELTGTVLDGPDARAVVPCVVAVSSDVPASQQTTLFSVASWMAPFIVSPTCRRADMALRRFQAGSVTGSGGIARQSTSSGRCSGR